MNAYLDASNLVSHGHFTASQLFDRCLTGSLPQLDLNQILDGDSVTGLHDSALEQAL